MIRSPDSYHYQVCSGIIDAARFNGLQVLEDVVVPDHQVGVTNTTVLEIAIDRVVASQSDVVFMCSFIFNQEYIMRGLRARNYSPKAVFSSSFYANFADTSLMEFVGTFGTVCLMITVFALHSCGPI
jgi:hypothetical protein